MKKENDSVPRGMLE